MTPQQIAKLAEVPAYHRDVGGDLPLDRWIGFAVKVIRDAGVATYESCEGGRGHAFREPTVRFFGSHSEALRAVAAALNHGLPVGDLRQCWCLSESNLLDGPFWEITFHPLYRFNQAAEGGGVRW